MSLGFVNLVADYYWVKALQYYMDPSQAGNYYKNLCDYLDLVVGVDPDYEYAYKFGGLAIPYDVGRYRYVNTKRGTEFLERGVQRFPNNWQLHFLLGYNYLNFSNDPPHAAEQFAAASRLPGSPSYLKAFAARVFAVGGDLDRAQEFAQATLASTNDAEIVAMMKSRIVDLEVEKELRRIESAARAFQEKWGKFPADLEELVASGFQSPPNRSYSLRPNGVAEASDSKERMVLHQDPRHAGFRGD